jgi:hypothetical protein
MASIKCEGVCYEEVVALEAESAEKARAICQRMVDENKKMTNVAEKKGIYISRRIAECKLINLDWRMEFAQCSILNSEN